MKKVTTMPTDLNPVAMIKREMTRRNISLKVMAKRLHRDPSTVNFMLTRENLSVERLLASSKALHFNFFLEIGYQIRIPGPEDMKGNPLKEQVRLLNVKLKEKENETEDLKRKLADAETLHRQELAESDVQRRLLETELNTLKQVLKDIIAARQV